jgi:hypothetical protein
MTIFKKLTKIDSKNIFNKKMSKFRKGTRIITLEKKIIDLIRRTIVIPFNKEIFMDY